MHFIAIAFLSLSLGPHGSAAIYLPDGAFLAIRLCSRTDLLQRHVRTRRALERHLLAGLAPLLPQLQSL